MVLGLAVAAVGFAAILGGATGFGAALLTTPLLLLVGLPVPEVVVVNLAATLVTRTGVLCRSHRHVDVRRVALLVAGSVPGAWLGAVTVGMIPPHVLKPAAGVLVALAGIRLAFIDGGRPKRPGPALIAVTGLTGGYLSTTTSLNGPPAAVLLARARVPPATFIADLAGYFVVTCALSLAILGVRGQIPLGVLWPALPMFLVAAVAGNLVGGQIARRLSGRAFRLTVVVLVVVSGLATALGS
ncbi:sulfite exporter TauE/SafE family protein [Pseudonocardia acaciae]|uniref:sulfite exporter TauE/SafE family protein n=1 Tax=Pseudonocardia acaciae TaxID=551276 RepID=UPI0004909BEC|nr:sulfite exporter TauE/SafE family protein [Pseudonocardia acaciae]